VRSPPQSPRQLTHPVLEPDDGLVGDASPELRFVVRDHDDQTRTRNRQVKCDRFPDAAVFDSRYYGRQRYRTKAVAFAN
jgi:hypothetical protein